MNNRKVSPSTTYNVMNEDGDARSATSAAPTPPIP
jgi:hypothetical protein